jgi:VWFA-related protein
MRERPEDPDSHSHSLTRPLGERRSRHGLALAIALTTAFPTLPQDAPRSGGYREEARVDRVVLDAHVTDNRGEIIRGLGPADFRVTVDGKVVPLESAEWVSAETPEVVAPEVPSDEVFTAPGSPVTDALREAAPGRMLIFFFQTDYNTRRLLGLVRMGLQARKFLDTLLPTDRVAVLSFDSHLKLRQDFTRDRAKIVAAIDASLRLGEPPVTVPDPQPGPSLARHIDRAGALKAVTPERAFALIATAAEPIPGGKSLLFFGWGLQTVGGMMGPNYSEQVAYSDALSALARARITVFTLDVTDADYHSLEGRIATLADVTGGTYEKTHIFPGIAMERVRRAIAGRYVLVFRKPDGPRGEHEVRVDLVGKKGRVLARGYYED